MQKKINEIQIHLLKAYHYVTTLEKKKIIKARMSAKNEGDSNFDKQN